MRRFFWAFALLTFSIPGQARTVAVPTRRAATLKPVLTFPALPAPLLHGGIGVSLTPSLFGLTLKSLTPLPALLPVSRTAVEAVAPYAAVAVAEAEFAASAKLSKMVEHVAQAVMPSLSTVKSFAVKSAALDNLFDGGPFSPESLFAGGGLEAKDFPNAFAFYSWLSKQSELEAAGENAALAKARILIEVAPILEKGAIFVIKENEVLTVMAQQDAAMTPARFDLSAAALASAEASYPARLLAEEFKTAEARDASEKTFVNKVELLNRLAEIARAVEPAKEERPGLADAGEMPVDPRKEPHEFLSRRLRDAMRAEDPYEALEFFETARKEAREYLDYRSASKFLERLRSQVELMARDMVPKLTDEMGETAARADSKAVERAAKAAYKYAEYAPAWKERVEKAHQRARNVLKLLDEFGLPDEKTGKPQVSRAELDFAAQASLLFSVLADDLGAQRSRKGSRMTGQDFIFLLGDAKALFALQNKELAPSPQAYKASMTVVESILRIVDALLAPEAPLAGQVRRMLSVWQVFNQAMLEASEKGTLEAIEEDALLFARQVEESV